jgi:formylglycine-generating enzyme required for sulfatase activity
MSITGHAAQDRHVFFNGAVTSTTMPSGNLFATDSIVGDLNFVKAGTFTQGSPADEFCRQLDEDQFTHQLTRDLAVMVTEVTRQMWADLKTAQPTLPDDPTGSKTTGPNYPVQSVKWYETVLFANLLSAEQGLQACYYTDPGFSSPVNAANHETDIVYCNFDANGYRLPTEGEWEFSCRAGTTSAFWMDVPNYDWTICGAGSCDPGTFPNLENAAWFCANLNDPLGDDSPKPAGLKEPNPWGLHDVCGNVWEWCWDWHGDYPNGSVTDYPGSATGTHRILRGAGWMTFSIGCRSAHRRAFTLHNRSDSSGFRLVRTVR